VDEAWVGFRLCLVIEPDIPIKDMLAPTIEERAALRYAQRYLPARYELIHVDTNGSPVTDPVLLTALSLPYRGSDQGGSDVNLSQRLYYLEQVIDLDSFRTCCRTVRDQAIGALRSDESVDALIRSASSLANSDLERRRIRLQRREASGDNIARGDLQMLESLLPAVERPSVRVDAMGCFIVASHGPGGRVS
jgi:ATP-dependent helicase HepA